MAASTMQSLTPPRFNTGRRHSCATSSPSPLRKATNLSFGRGRRDSSQSAQTIGVADPADHPHLWNALNKSTTPDGKRVQWQDETWTMDKSSENNKGQEALKGRKKSGMPSFRILQSKKKQEEQTIGEDHSDEQEIEPEADANAENFQIQWFNSEVDYEQQRVDEQPPRDNDTSCCTPVHRTGSPTDPIEEETSQESVAKEEELSSPKRPNIFQRLSLKTNFVNRRRNRSKSDPSFSNFFGGGATATLDAINESEPRRDVPQSPQSPQSRKRSILLNFRRRNEQPSQPGFQRRGSFSTSFGYASA